MNVAKLKPWTRARIARRHMRMAAIHESGHATVASAHGIIGSIWISQTYSEDPNEKLWTGQFECESRPLTQLSASVRATFGLAGMVSEMMADEPDIEPESCFDMFAVEPNCLSTTDLHYLPDPDKWPCLDAIDAFAETIRILKERAKLHKRIVAAALKHGSFVFESVMQSLVSEFESKQSAVKK